MATAARLPGIYFETPPPAPPPLLPRMDIAAFAGFVPSGPIGVPFAVEDPNRFQDVFGVDLPLAWDADLNQMRLAQTAPAVRAFFRNGGTRCWVLRLAKGALYNRWTIPGLLATGDGGLLHAGWVRARCEGSWSDELTVNATLLESPLPTGAVTDGGTLPLVSGLEEGDVAQLDFVQTGALAYYDFSGDRWFWFQAANLAASPPLPFPGSLTLLGAGEDSDVPFTSFGVEGSEVLIGVSRATALTIAPGAWLRAQIGTETLVLQVETIAAGQGTSGSPPADEMATLTSTLAWWQQNPAAGWAANRGAAMQASVVTFELWAWPQGAAVQQISDLGLSAMSPRYWGLLPTDSELYEPVTTAAPIPYAALTADIDHPRFPLAGCTSLGLGLPLGMTALVRTDFTQAASQPGASALERDGLTVYDASLFVDPNLVLCNSSTLLQNAYYYENQAPNAGPLRGIHGLLDTDEISLLAAPDAIHGGWQQSSQQAPTLASPDPIGISEPDANGSYTITWAAVAGAVGYTVQESSDPLFGSQVTTLDGGAATSMARINNPSCALTLYYRVAAYGAGDGPWSATADVTLGTGDFVAVGALLLDGPQIEILEEGDRVILEWSIDGGADSFTLQTAGDAQFESPETLYSGAGTSFQYWVTPGPPAYFRVSAVRAGQSTPWSKTVSTTAEPESPWQTISFPAFDPANPPVMLRQVHQAMLTMAAARGDLVALLSLPYSYRKADAIGYEATLFAAAQQDSSRTPSYGALYHPWVVTQDSIGQGAQSLRTLTPDGAVAGAIASTTLNKGAWIAPANIALNNAVALAPALDPGTPLAFAASQINLIAQQPEGFLITQQNTLIADSNSQLQALNVRRLLILLRRLALREGVRYVFQNISPAFERAVTRWFQQWMQQLLIRGAFAGASAQDSYQVVADSTVNPPAAVAQGRFVVELRVAPALPMQFLTVQLVQSGGQLTLVEA